MTKAIKNKVDRASVNPLVIKCVDFIMHSLVQGTNVALKDIIEHAVAETLMQFACDAGIGMPVQADRWAKFLSSSMPSNKETADFFDEVVGMLQNHEFSEIDRQLSTITINGVIGEDRIWRLVWLLKTCATHSKNLSHLSSLEKSLMNYLCAGLAARSA